QRELPFALTHTFGGHSSCVELETGSNEYFVCDMGSGARPFVAHVLARQGGRPATVNVFMSHLHWDHIMGFPFFGPAYVPGTRIRIHGCHEVLEQALRLQQAPPCFPVAFDPLAEVASVKADWGHSSNIVGVELCQMAGVKHLVLFHHEPSSDDAAIEAVLKDTRHLEELTRAAQPLRVSAAYDGLEIDL